MIELASAINCSAKFRLHPLGFYYLKYRSASSVSRRLHVWLQSDPDHPKNDRHQHSFDIDSTVMTGCVRNELFKFEEAPDGIEREFAVTYEGGRSSLSPTGRVGILGLFAAFDSAVGGSYFLNAGVIHCVTATERPCVTMLTTSEREIPIFAYGNDTSEPPFVRRLVDMYESQQIKELLIQIATPRP